MNVKRIVGIVLIVIAITILATNYKNSEAIPPSIIFIVVGLFLIVSKSKKRKMEIYQKRQETYLYKQKEKGTKIIQDGINASLKHTTGLPLAEGTLCILTYNTDGFTISGGGATFKLPLEKVMKLEIMSDVEIHKQYVSSTGGAIAGGLMFGALGAMIWIYVNKLDTKKRRKA